MIEDSGHDPRRQRADHAPPGWLDTGGEMGARVRAFDWSATPLGPIEAWPASLKALVAGVLHSRHPMSLWWGAELIQIYNDAYLPTLRREQHPAALGQSGRDFWPELWPIIGPKLDEVMRRGVATGHGSTSYSPVFDDDGQIAGILVVCAESQGKDDFLATASHELRTPLNAILGWAKMMRSGQLDQRAFLRGAESIERNARSQVRLIEDILDGARIINGNLQLELKAVDLAAVVRAALEASGPAAAAKRIALAVLLEPGEACVAGDPERLQQVVWNLVDNAIKFTPKGGTVEVALRRAGSAIELRVADSGEGISAEFLPHVFERFRQAEASTTRRHGGLGLGLALVRHLVQAHGGTVRAESEGKDKGAQFTVLLPMLPAELGPLAPGEPAETTAAPGDEPPPAASLRGISALVVDDEADARDLLATVLSAHGAAVTTASDAARALELVASGQFSVLVSDVAMPDADGYALLRSVRTLTGARGARLPAIALTAYAREEERRQALEAGFTAHLAKPVDPDALVRLVATHAASSPAAPLARPAEGRSDPLAKFEKVLLGEGVHAALRFLNSRTSHRFTGLYRFDPPILRNLYLFDADAPHVVRGEDAPMNETYCSIVGAGQQPFTTEDTRRDERLLAHPAREQVVSYCGVLLRREDESPFGSLCHFDVVPREIPLLELRWMELAAPLLMRAMGAHSAR